MKAAAEHLGVDENCAAFISELVFLAGLVVIDADDKILPTHSFDLWLTQNHEVRWRTIASLWLITSRVSGLVGRGDSKHISALGPELDRVNAASTRKQTLEILRENPYLLPDSESFLALVKWKAPSRRSSTLQTELV